MIPSHSVRLCISVFDERGVIIGEPWYHDWQGLNLKIADTMRKELEDKAKECADRYTKTKFGKYHRLVSALNALLKRGNFDD